jgi:PAS domain S-box-containing protein
MEHSAIGMALVGVNGKWLKVNEAMCRLVGYTEPELLEIDFQTITHPEDLDADLAQVRRMLAGEIETYQMEKRYIHKTGRIVWILLTVALAREADGTPAYFISQIQDITDRREAEATIRRDAHILSQIKDAVVCTDAAGLVMYWNDAAERLFGWKREELMGQPVLQRFPPEAREKVRQFRERIMRGELSAGMEWEDYHKDGSRRWVHWHSYPIRDEAGQVSGIVTLATDITERRQVMYEMVRAKEAAEAAAQAKSQFLAILSHEIRTPLNPIIGAAQLLLEDDCPPEQRELVETINNAGEHLLTLLNDMLDVAKMESGRMELALAPCVTQDVVRGVLEIKRNDARRKGLILSGKYDRKLAYCYLTDEPRLRQIMLNLVGNAVKFTNEGEVVARVEMLERLGTRDRLRFSVRDTGIGMEAEQMRRLFEPFYQVDGSSTRRYDGVGLGLAICRRLVELMHGKIGVESQLGEGSTFWFIVDLERGPAVPGKPEPVNTASPFPGWLRVLLVEDDARNRSVVVTMLQRASCTVAVAPTARAALELFKPGAFDAVLMDLRLPDLDGCETARLFRNRERDAGLPPAAILALTANTSERDMKAAKAAGMDDFLAKPIRRQRLIAALKKHTNNRGKAPGKAKVRSKAKH